MGVVIVTDSTSEITIEQGKTLGIEIVPLKVLFQEGEYFDGIDLSPEEFYKKLKNAKKLPTTTQPTPAAFEEIFKKHESDEIVAVLLAGKLSGTVQSATIASENVSAPIFILDSESATIGLRILVERAIYLRDEGKSGREIFETLQKEKKKIRIRAMVDTLEYLKKGGRLSKTVAFTGTLLGIKPIIELKDGTIHMVSKARGTKGAYENILKLIKEDGEIDFTKPVGLGYTGERKLFDPFTTFIEERTAFKDAPISAIGSVIGTHAGPGAAAIAYFVR